VSTTKNTLFDISCPDPTLRTHVFEGLLALDLLNANPVRYLYENITWNRFLQYGQGHHAILQAVEHVRVSTNPIHLSDGLLSEFFIMSETLDQDVENSNATDAYCSLKKDVLKYIDIVHVHIRFGPGNNGRRMALSLLHQTVEKQGYSERWITSETSDIDTISKTIVQCML